MNNVIFFSRFLFLGTFNVIKPIRTTEVNTLTTATPKPSKTPTTRPSKAPVPAQSRLTNRLTPSVSTKRRLSTLARQIRTPLPTSINLRPKLTATTRITRSVTKNVEAPQVQPVATATTPTVATLATPPTPTATTNSLPPSGTSMSTQPPASSPISRISTLDWTTKHPKSLRCNN